MKIAFVATQWQSHWAGSEELWWKTARHALESGHEVAVVNFRWPEPHPKIRELRDRGALHLQLARPDDRKRSAMSRWRRKLEFDLYYDIPPDAVPTTLHAFGGPSLTDFSDTTGVDVPIVLAS